MTMKKSNFLTSLSLGVLLSASVINDASAYLYGVEPAHVCAADLTDVQKVHHVISTHKTACPPHELNLDALRSEYECKVKELAPLKRELETATSNGTLVAQALHTLRRETGRVIKEETPWFFRYPIYLRNMWAYNDPLGPTFESLVKKGKTAEQIADSATRTGGDDLGLKNKYVRSILSFLGY